MGAVRRAVHEVAAFTLDHGHFSGVPPTGLVEMVHSEFNHVAGGHRSSVHHSTSSCTLARQSSNSYCSFDHHGGRGGGTGAASQRRSRAISTSQDGASQASIGAVVKTGSIQAFVLSHGAASDYYDRKFAVREVHKIGILDLRGPGFPGRNKKRGSGVPY